MLKNQILAAVLTVQWLLAPVAFAQGEGQPGPGPLISDNIMAPCLDRVPEIRDCLKNNNSQEAKAVREFLRSTLSPSYGDCNALTGIIQSDERAKMYATCKKGKTTAAAAAPVAGAAETAVPAQPSATIRSRIEACVNPLPDGQAAAVLKCIECL